MWKSSEKYRFADVGKNELGKKETCAKHKIDRSQHGWSNKSTGTILVLRFHTYRPNNMWPAKTAYFGCFYFILFFHLNQWGKQESRRRGSRRRMPTWMRCWKEWCVYRSITVTVSDHRPRLICLYWKLRKRVDSNSKCHRYGMATAWGNSQYKNKILKRLNYAVKQNLQNDTLNFGQHISGPLSASVQAKRSAGGVLYRFYRIVNKMSCVCKNPGISLQIPPWFDYTFERRLSL